MALPIEISVEVRSLSQQAETVTFVMKNCVTFLVEINFEFILHLEIKAETAIFDMPICVTFLVGRVPAILKMLN